MTIEVATYIGDLVTSNPEHDDWISQGDDHFRLLKTAVKNTLPNATKAFRFPTVNTKTTTGSIASSEDNSIAVVTGTGVTLTLPSLTADDAGWEITIQNAHASGTTTIAPPSGTINGAANYALSKQYSSARVIWTGTAFIIDEDLLSRTLLNMATSRLLGRTTASAGAVEEISVGAGLTFAAGVLSANVVVPFEPQGRLSMTSGVPINPTDVTAGTAVYYTPYKGSNIPLYSGSAWASWTFTELTLSLNSSPHLANNIYDVFVAENPSSAGTLIIGTGPAWSTVTEGSGARGSGAGTTAISRTNGILVNTNAIVLKNGATTYSSVSAGRAVYVGTFIVDGTNAQLTCHVSAGSTKRNWGLWNAYHRKQMQLEVFESTSSWTLNTATVRASNSDGANAIRVVSGFAEEAFEIEFLQNATVDDNATNYPTIGIGKNSTSSMSTAFRGVGLASGVADGRSMLRAQYYEAPFLGANSYTALEGNAAGTNSHTMLGGNNNFSFTAKFWA